MIEIVTGHRVVWRHGINGVVGAIACAAGKESICHKCDEGCGHPTFVPGQIHVECLISDDIETLGVEMMYVGDRDDVHDGDVWASRKGDEWVWWYAGDTHADLGKRRVEDVSVVGGTVGP